MGVSKDILDLCGLETKLTGKKMAAG